MYFASIESNRAAMAKHNETLRENVKARLSHVKLDKIKGDREGFKRAECAPNRKAKAKLSARIGDYDNMNKRTDFKAPAGAYHKPGSAKFH